MEVRATTLRAVLILAVGVLVAACAAPSQTEPNSPERAVEDAYLAFRAAVLAGDGRAAAELATEESWTFFGDLAVDALEADRSRLERMDIDRQLAVLVLRHGLTSQQLQSMSGQELLAQMIDEGWIWIAQAWVTRDSLARARLSDFYVLTRRATASGQSVGSWPPDMQWPAGLGAAFRYERDDWRVQFHFKSTEHSRKTRIVSAYFSGQKPHNTEDYVYESLQRVTGRKAGPEIWGPPS